MVAQITETEMNTFRPLHWSIRIMIGVCITYALVAAGYLIVFLCQGAALSEHLPLPRWGDQGE